MLTITNTEVANESVTDGDEVTLTPTQYFLNVTDQGGNGYLIPTTEGTVTAVKELMALIGDNLRTIKTA